MRISKIYICCSSDVSTQAHARDGFYSARPKSLENMSEFDNIVNSTAEAAEIRGHAKGHAEGRAEGDLDRALKVAREMLADGMPVDKICKYTELSVEQIEALKA